MISVTIEGLDKWQTICDPNRFLREMDKAVQRAAEDMRDQTKLMPPVSAKTTGYDQPGIPVDSGRMRQSIQKKKVALLAADVVAPVNYSEFVHSGTRKMPARPFFRYLLENFNGLQRIDIIIRTTLENLVKP
jgi:HK97 gp10 family phage protein